MVRTRLALAAHQILPHVAANQVAVEVAAMLQSSVRQNPMPLVPAESDVRGDMAGIYASAGALHDSREALRVSSGLASFDWPMYVLHPPKCGGDIATTFGHAVCDSLSPDEIFKDTDQYQMPDKCLNSDRIAYWYWGHDPLKSYILDEIPEPSLSHVVTMLRSPSERLVSGFYHNRHDCRKLREQIAPECTDENDIEGPKCEPLQRKATPESLEAYAECVGDCYARMLTGVQCFSRDWEREEDERAKRFKKATQVVDGLGFVGLTEEFALSVCLWHARFGGPCYEVEFGNHRIGPHNDDYGATLFTTRIDEYMTGYTETQMFTAKTSHLLDYDTRLYERARARFWSEVAEHKVTQEKCSALCPDHPADVFATVPSPEEARKRASQ